MTERHIPAPRGWKDKLILQEDPHHWRSFFIQWMVWDDYFGEETEGAEVGQDPTGDPEMVVVHSAVEPFADHIVDQRFQFETKTKANQALTAARAALKAYRESRKGASK